MSDIEGCSCTKYIAKDEMLKLSLETENFSVYGNLNKGEKIILKYYGKLLPETEVKDKKIFINYGYGNLWTDKKVQELNICKYSDKLCYCTEFELENIENLYFCFMDSDNKWDLNDNSSYMITIDSPLTTIAKTNVAVAIPDDEYQSFTNRLFKKIVNKLINFFYIIGNVFDKKIREE